MTMRMPIVLLISGLVHIAALSGGVELAQAQSCALPQKPMVEAQLMFGRNIGGKLGVTEGRWSQFLEREIAPRFPDGLTVVDAAGQWRDAKTGRLIREPSKMVTVVVVQDAALSEKIEAIADAYKRRFRQDSVGVVIRQACVSF
jgi:hypothetical protein